MIAIDLTVKKHEDSKAWKRERKAKKYENAEKFMGQLLHWITQRPDLSQYQENLRHINVYINPDLKGFSAASFSDKKVIKMIEKGEEAGKKAMKDLLKINKKIQKQHNYKSVAVTKHFGYSNAFLLYLTQKLQNLFTQYTPNRYQPKLLIPVCR